jgi:peroxiredoxin
MKNQQSDSSAQSLSGFEKVARIVGIVLIAGFAIEILFFVVGYVGMVRMKIETAYWFLWSFFNSIFMLMTPIVFIITICGAGYLLFRVLKKGGNRRVAIISVIACGMNLLALLSIYATGWMFYRHVKDNSGNAVVAQRNWIGKSLPDFSFQGIQEEMIPITNKDLQSKWSVLVFWATYNTPWSSNFRCAQGLYKNREELKTNVFAVATDESKEDIRNFLEKHPSSMPVYYDLYGSYVHRIVIGSPEQVFIVAPNGRIKASPPIEEIEAVLRTLVPTKNSVRDE